MGSQVPSRGRALPAERNREAGTLLELVWKLGGDEARAREALRAGYALTGSFRGREAELFGEAG